MKKLIPYGKQLVDNNDIKCVTQALKGNYLTNGLYLNLYENKIRKFIGSKYALACSSGTSQFIYL